MVIEFVLGATLVIMSTVALIIWWPASRGDCERPWRFAA
jgi:hypothetical protein